MAKQTSDQPDSASKTNQTDEFVESAETNQEPTANPAPEGIADGMVDDSALFSGTGNGKIEELLQQLDAAQAASRQAKDDLLRVQAEMQNLRRRTEQDIEKAHKYGQERFSNELLGVMDNLERALEAARGHDDETVKAIFDGVEITRKSFVDCFKRFNIEAIDPLGEPFDPQLHQAMSIQENPEVEPNTVTAVMQKGYTLHGRVIRPAMVMVSKQGSE